MGQLGLEVSLVLINFEKILITFLIIKVIPCQGKKKENEKNSMEIATVASGNKFWQGWELWM